MSHHDTCGRSTAVLRDLVREALLRSANAPLLRTPNPHRNHPILGDPKKVDELIESWPSAVDQIIYPFPAATGSSERIGRHAA